MRKFYRWYDTIKEPWRLLFFIVISLPAYLCVSLNHPMLTTFGIGWFAFLLITRWRYIHVKEKNNGGI